ncbi:hypothetical protein BCR33DRAFT_459266 [Rhizoclosmatium globosum]|uniref:Uncharacterized protein n=1 Tax=Rhizoclosmatium globosum TaxID=329046 RepID=A0A1Y2CX23_9FUNG|nr:hypothetical protein BCR33DRAFT_459266 [Rhizoclosmatium globosum]|eukprot:ORY51583.1 hypothetical protein BCR33DRAFT_459266 [Rhizoclosmatium globosum]
MQQFRALHPDLCTNEVEARSPERTAHMYKHYTRDEPLDDREVDTEYYMTGFFTINDRLFPERATHTPFMNNEGLLATEEPPVKVSIPLSKLQTQAKVYKAHRRSSFDPTESMNIAAHLHKGYETAGALSNKKFSDGRVAMQDHIRKKKPNIVSFF